MPDTKHGAFDPNFADKKTWKLDPGLWAAIQATLPDPPLNVLDLGCGLGRYVRALRERGYNARGVDGIPGVAQKTAGVVLEVDLAAPAFFQTSADWALSFEVGEHIPDERAGFYLDNVAAAAARGIITSWAYPGQRGRNHINCQPADWVAEQFARRGWLVDMAKTDAARDIAGRGWNKKLLVLKPANR